MVAVLYLWLLISLMMPFYDNFEPFSRNCKHLVEFVAIACILWRKWIIFLLCCLYFSLYHANDEWQLRIVLCIPSSVKLMFVHLQCQVQWCGVQGMYWSDLLLVLESAFPLVFHLIMNSRTCLRANFLSVLVMGLIMEYSYMS